MKHLIKEIRLEDLSIPELADAASKDYKEYILYTYANPGKYSRSEDYGWRTEKDKKYYISQWFKEG